MYLLLIVRMLHVIYVIKIDVFFLGWSNFPVIFSFFMSLPFNVYLSNSKVWLMYKNEKESIEIVTIAINQNNMSLVYLEESHLNGQEKVRMSMKRSESVAGHEMSDDEDEEGEIVSDSSLTDIKEKYFKLIFEPYKFSRTNIFKALGVSYKTKFLLTIYFTSFSFWGYKKLCI